MKFTRAFVALLSLGASLISITANAIEVDNMFLFSNDDGTGVYTVTNNSDERIYIIVNVTELTIDGDEIEKKEYNRSNIDEWKLNVYPTKTIIEPGFKRKISVKVQCPESGCSTQEQVFQVNVVPKPYFENEIDAKQQGRFAFSVGMSPYFIKSGKESSLKMDVKRIRDNIRFHNTGTSYNRVTIESEDCNKEQKNCKANIVVLSNRVFNWQIPKNLKEKKLKVTIDSPSKKYSESYFL